jgi:TolB-like protein/Tfp pilus assembly protein PilF
MVTGTCPFPGNNAAEIVRAIQDEQLARVDKLVPKTPARLVRIINKALQKDRSLRYQHASELKADLQALSTFLARRRTRQYLIAGSVATVIALLMTGFGLWRILRGREPGTGHVSAGTAIAVKSLAVLPLENRTGDPAQEYLADGMTDALISNLTRIGSLRVISRTSAMHYKGTRKPLPEIARELNVSAVMEGAVFRSGKRVRISAQLVDPASDQNLWARDYDSELRDILQVQNEVASSVAHQVAGHLTPQQQAALASSKPVKPEAYEAYLKGRHFTFPVTTERLKKAVAYYKAAIQADPTYAPAYAGLADAYMITGFWDGGIQHPEVLAMEAARKAISLDDSSADAHACLATVLHRYMQDWTGADREFKRALELDPNNSYARLRYGNYYANIGLRKPACNEYRLAHTLDPLNTRPIQAVAVCLHEAGHPADAVQMMKGAVELEPENAELRWNFGDLYERQGMFAEAMQQYRKGLKLSGGHEYFLILMASAYAGSGQIQRAESLLPVIQQKTKNDHWINAGLYARLGRKEEAIHELQADTANCGPGTCGPGESLFVSTWRFAPLRSDPRFQAILRKFHYPASAFRN